MEMVRSCCTRRREDIENLRQPPGQSPLRPGHGWKLVRSADLKNFSQKEIQGSDKTPPGEFLGGDAASVAESYDPQHHDQPPSSVAKVAPLTECLVLLPRSWLCWSTSIPCASTALCNARMFQENERCIKCQVAITKEGQARYSTEVECNDSRMRRISKTHGGPQNRYRQMEEAHRLVSVSTTKSNWSSESWAIRAWKCSDSLAVCRSADRLSLETDQIFV
uniref:Uncharacterized protein n=1 Tax=Sphaerodactylus townsendi TaxID=933632 RepID=A0ACB8EDS4_9SAUR